MPKAPEFKYPEYFQLQPHREYIRNHPDLPPPSAGYVVEDLDMLIRGYGPRFKTDKDGKFMLLELKFGKKWLTYGQLQTFRLLHGLLRSADPDKKRYIGFFIVNYSDVDWNRADLAINHIPLSKEKFDRFLALELVGIPELDWVKETEMIGKGQGK